MQDSTTQAIRDHAAREYPRECCGVVIVRKGREKYVPCRNMASTGEGEDYFILNGADYAAAEEEGSIIAIVHSHPNTSPQPSQADLVGCEASGLPWVIVNWPTGQIVQFQPSGYKAPLTGRVFSHGILDCYSLIQDYYKEVLHIQLPDAERQYLWWETGQNLYMDNFERAGFRKVEDLQLHDVILIQLASTKANHGAVYIGNDYILHHPQHRLSSRDVYGGYWRKNTVCFIRHKDVQ